MKNYVNLKRLVYELNRTLGITSDIERDNIIIKVTLVVDKCIYYIIAF